MTSKYIDYSFNEIAGQVLKKHRELSGMSLEQLGKKTNQSKQNINRYENNSVRIKTDTFNKLCYAMGLDPQDIFDEINIKYLKNAKL